MTIALIGLAGVAVGSILNMLSTFGTGWLTFRRDRNATRDERQLAALDSLGTAAMELHLAFGRISSGRTFDSELAEQFDQARNGFHLKAAMVISSDVRHAARQWYDATERYHSGDPTKTIREVESRWQELVDAIQVEVGKRC